MQATALKKGDRVYVDPEFPGARAEVLGRVFVVDKVNPKNVRCSAEDGGKGINYPADSLRPYEGGALLPATLTRPFEPPELFNSGEIVTLTRAWKDWTTEKPLVVLADKLSKVNVAPLGGDGTDRYLRVPREGLTRRSVEWLAEALLESATVSS